jgi:hypothetical protein
MNREHFDDNSAITFLRTDRVRLSADRDAKLTFARAARALQLVDALSLRRPAQSGYANINRVRPETKAAPAISPPRAQFNLIRQRPKHPRRAREEV